MATQTTELKFVKAPEWNVRSRTLNKRNRTNNHCESFHSKLRYFVEGSGKPTIWAFIAGMLSYQSDTNNNIASMRQGHKPLRRIPKEVQKNQRIYSAAKQFGKIFTLDYLDLVMNL